MITFSKEAIAIYSMNLAGYLMQKGFVLQCLKDNPKYHGRHMFIFMNSVALQESIMEYQTNKNNKFNKT